LKWSIFVPNENYKIMKIKLLIPAALFAIFLLPSCMREFGCTCNHVIVEGEPADSTWVTTTTVTNNNKSDAAANCEFLGGTSWSGQVAVEETCTLD
jgi:hypothetical protein